VLLTVSGLSWLHVAGVWFQSAVLGAIRSAIVINLVCAAFAGASSHDVAKDSVDRHWRVVFATTVTDVVGYGIPRVGDNFSDVIGG
jgi:hypothetical protein